ncbi:MAG: hypothetical protein HAW67_06010 [Endozoicomonadaceae bacterium]|nr:hypothetical protein [Endozoicomonadaceae bacterium]
MRVTQAELEKILINPKIKIISDVGAQVKKRKNALKLPEVVGNRHRKALDCAGKNPHLITGVKNGEKVKNAQYEHWLQVAIFDYIFEYLSSYYEDFYAIPNGGLRIGFTGSELKDEGLRIGTPDVHCDVSMGIYYGLRIEVKWGRKRPSEAQIKQLNLKHKRGYYTCVVTCLAEFIEVSNEYFSLESGDKMTWFKNADLWLQ